MQIPSRSLAEARAAITPFLAYKSLLDEDFIDWKWMFLSSDDTLFFVDAAQAVVKDLDPTLPYFISGIILSFKLPKY